MNRPNDPTRKSSEDQNLLERTTEAFQDNMIKSAPVAAASYTLIGAIILFGFIGYGIDWWRGGSSHVFLIGGLFLGIVVGFVDLAKVVWKR